MNFLESISTNHETMNAYTLTLRPGVFVVQFCLVPALRGWGIAKRPRVDKIAGKINNNRKVLKYARYARNNDLLRQKERPNSHRR